MCVDLFHSFAAEVEFPVHTRIAWCVFVGQGGNGRQHRFKQRENMAVFA